MKNFLRIIVPGLLVAATGVGAGDLITAGLAGKYLGLTILWAPLLGALLKWSLNEGLVRWQIATETTLLEGWFNHLGKWIEYIFLFYLIFWSVMVGGALINACGVAGHSFISFGDAQTSKIVWGIIHSLIGILLVKKGSFKFFEKVMSTLVFIMFFVVIITALSLSPNLSEVLNGTFVPAINFSELGWIIGVLGGVGGTITILSYGYWIKEEGRNGEIGLKESRLDLAFSYLLTAFFSMAMIIIGSKLNIDKNSQDNFAEVLSMQLGSQLGVWAKWIFLFGFWGGVFSSLLGVWQSVPYLFTDLMKLRGKKIDSTDLKKTKYYSNYLYFISLFPIVTLFINFEMIQQAYAVMGALFMPLLAVSLLILNNSKHVGKFKNNIFSNGVLILVLLFFGYTGFVKIFKMVGII